MVLLRLLLDKLRVIRECILYMKEGILFVKLLLELIKYCIDSLSVVDFLKLMNML